MTFVEVGYESKMADTELLLLSSQPASHGEEGSQSTSEGTGEGNTEPRLMITKIVCENFKSYAGIKELGPFHKVHYVIDDEAITARSAVVCIHFMVFLMTG